MATRTHLSLLTLALASASLFSSQPMVRDSFRVDQMATQLESSRTALGLNSDHAFRLRSAQVDELGMTHAAFQQFYKSVPVFGGEIITHADKTGTAMDHTNALKAGINLNVTPSLTKEEALAIAHREMAPRAAYKTAPEAELVVFPVMTQVRLRPGTDAAAFEYQPSRYHLAYVVTAKVEDVAQTVHMKYVVDAHTGAILKSWSDTHTSSAVGVGHSQYSGQVSINTNSTGTGYELRDLTRGIGGTFGNNVVTNLSHTTSGNGAIYTDSDNVWGDSQNYVEGTSTVAANGQTAAVDAAFGIQSTWDMYKKVLGRNGIDGNGKAAYGRVHYSNGFDNAFWDDSCFCMTFGDGTVFRTLTSIDVVGHEVSHGVCANNGLGGLIYIGESGGLNESNSDIMGTMTEFYDLGGGASAGSSSIPATGGNWTIGEQVITPPLRYMYKPSLDGNSPDAWSEYVGSGLNAVAFVDLDVHYSSGPGNRAFYFLSQGASSNSNDSSYTQFLPGGMTGIGNDHATRIHYRALTTYYVQDETYAQARTAHMRAAADLYGTASPEYIAVQSAFHGINVENTITATITTPSSDISVPCGVSQSFNGSATDSSSTATLTYLWTFGDGSTASTASTSHAYASTGTYTATFKVTDNTGVFSLVHRTVTVTAPVAVSISPINQTVNPGESQVFTATVSGTNNTAMSWACTGGGLNATTGSSVTWTAPLTLGTYTVTASSQVDPTKKATATISVANTFGETEPNNSTSGANIVPANVGIIVGSVATVSDADYFAVSVAPGKTLTVSTDAGVRMSIQSSSGTILGSVTDGGSLNYTNTGATAVTMYLVMAGYYDTSGPRPIPVYGPYSVSIQR